MPPHLLPCGCSVTTDLSQPQPHQDSLGGGNSSHQINRMSKKKKKTIEKMMQIREMWAGRAEHLPGRRGEGVRGWGGEGARLGFHPSPQESGRWGGQLSHPLLNGEFKSSLGHMKPCLKRKPYGQRFPQQLDFLVCVDSNMRAQGSLLKPLAVCTADFLAETWQPSWLTSTYL